MVQFVFRFLRNIDLSFGSQERLASGICIAVTSITSGVPARPDEVRKNLS